MLLVLFNPYDRAQSSRFSRIPSSDCLGLYIGHSMEGGGLTALQRPILFNPYQALPFRARVDLGAMAMKV